MKIISLKLVGLMVLGLMMMSTALGAAPDASKLAAKVGDTMTYKYDLVDYVGNDSAPVFSPDNGANVTITQGASVTVKVDTINSNGTVTTTDTMGSSTATDLLNVTELGSPLVTIDWTGFSSSVNASEYNVTDGSSTFSATANFTYTFPGATYGAYSFPSTVFKTYVSVTYDKTTGWAQTYEYSYYYGYGNGTVVDSTHIKMSQGSAGGSLPGFEFPIAMFAIMLVAVPIYRRRR